MTTDQNSVETGGEFEEDGLSALRQLAALDRATGGASLDADVVETIPDWLELLLAKYGEQASNLIGIPAGPSSDLRPSASTQFVPGSQEESKIASLLEQLAVEAETKPAPGRLATSVEWGEYARPEEDQAADWLSRIGTPPTPPPVAPAIEEAPDWLGDISRPGVKTEDKTHPAGIEDVPDWLQELQPPRQPQAGLQPLEPAPPEAPLPTADLPDWVRELTAATSAEPSGGEGGPPTPEDEGLDWLRELRAGGQPPEGKPTAPQPAEAPPAASGAEEGEIPDWLALLAAASAPQGRRPAPAPAEGLSTAEKGEPGEPATPETLITTPVQHPLEAGITLLGPSPPESAAAVPREPEPEVPDWLIELEPTQAAPAAALPGELPGPPSEVSPFAEVPDWLEEPAPEPGAATPAMGPPVPPPEPAVAVPSEPEVPDWLASLRAEGRSSLEVAAEPVSYVEYPPGEPAEEPDWLAEMRSNSKGDVLEHDEVVEAEEEALPDWLAELRSLREVGEPPSSSVKALEQEVPEVIPVESPPSVEYPPTEVEAEIPEAEEALAVETEARVAEAEGELDWLAEIETAFAEIEAMEETPSAEVAAPVGPAGTSEWLIRMPPAESGEEEETLQREEAAMRKKEIPSEWLIHLEEEQAIQLREKREEESEGVLAGIPGLLPISEEEAEVEPEMVKAPPSHTGVPAVPDVEGARLFKEITTKPLAEYEKVEEAPQPESRLRRVLRNLVWAMVFIILVIAIAVTIMAILDRTGDLLSGPAFREFLGSPLVIDPAPVNTFRSEITKLPTDAVAVVSFDYGPSTEAEMGPLAEVILRDMLENQVRVIGVSLRPEGTAMAQRLFAQFESEYPYGERTINLGYLPGQTAGTRSLTFLVTMPVFQDWSQTLADYAAWQDVEGLADVALIVSVADSPQAVRWWVEQVGSETLANRPIVAAVSAAVAPTVRPYHNELDPKSGQVLGLLSGVTDAAAYENRLQQPGRAVESLAAQSVAHLGLVALSLVGTVVGFRTHASRG